MEWYLQVLQGRNPNHVPFVGVLGWGLVCYGTTELDPLTVLLCLYLQVLEKIMLDNVNPKLTSISQLIHAVSGNSDLSDEAKLAVVYKFIETLEDLVKALDETKH